MLLRPRNDAMATAHSPNDLTRQQLDELDALLQRMLALPLNAPESTPNLRTASVELPLPEMPAMHRPAPAYTPTQPTPNAPTSAREVSPPTIWRGEAPAAAAVLPTPNTTAAAPTPLTRTPPPASQSRAANAPSAAAIFRGALEATQPGPALAPVRNEPPTPAAVTLKQTSPAVLLPLIGFNQLLNLGLDRLGLFGRILQTGAVRNVLGVAAAAIFAFTLTRIAQNQGWANLPFSLPWPN
jgi:hypothetical protein